MYRQFNFINVLQSVHRVRHSPHKLYNIWHFQTDHQRYLVFARIHRNDFDNSHELQCRLKFYRDEQQHQNICQTKFEVFSQLLCV